MIIAVVRVEISCRSDPGFQGGNCDLLGVERNQIPSYAGRYSGQFGKINHANGWLLNYFSKCARCRLRHLIYSLASYAGILSVCDFENFAFCSKTEADLLVRVSSLDDIANNREGAGITRGPFIVASCLEKIGGKKGCRHNGGN